MTPDAALEFRITDHQCTIGTSDRFSISLAPANDRLLSRQLTAMGTLATAMKVG